MGHQSTFSRPGLSLLALTTILLVPPLFAAGVPRPDHVVIVMEENRTYKKIIDSSSAPYLNSLAQDGALFTDSHAIGHPSQPNYLYLFSGSNQGVKSDSCPHTFSTPNLGEALIGAGFTFIGYAEDLPSVGDTSCSSGKYYRKHAPWVNFANVPGTASMPFTSWPSDFNLLPTLCFVVPNQNHDMHDGTVKEADTWLEDHIHAYREWAMSHNSLLIVTWDEEDGKNGNHIATIFVGPMVRPGLYPETINHLNVLRTLEDMYGLPAAGESANATPITDVWTAVEPAPDCNQNGVADAADIAAGTSSDENGDDTPDECQTVNGRIELAEDEPGCVLVVLESDVATKAGELGLTYDSRAVIPRSVHSTDDLPSTALIRFDFTPANNCSPEMGDAAGLTLGWINSSTGDVVSSPGRHVLLQICFDLPPGAYQGNSQPLEFVNCLGTPESPVRNVVTDSNGKSLFVPTRDGQVSVPARPIFRRGDVTGDGRLAISDAILGFGCLFRGAACPACQAEMDVNDDDKVDLTDGIYLLSWLFMNGPPPASPFPGCGPDETPGSLSACVQPASCP